MKRPRALPTYAVSIFMAGDIETAKRHIRRCCYEDALCVTVTPTTFIYTAGEEAGFTVGFVNYPRFPRVPSRLRARAMKLARELMRECCQRSALVMDASRTDWLTLDPPALARSKSP